MWHLCTNHKGNFCGYTYRGAHWRGEMQLYFCLTNLLLRYPWAGHKMFNCTQQPWSGRWSCGKGATTMVRTKLLWIQTKALESCDEKEPDSVWETAQRDLTNWMCSERKKGETMTYAVLLVTEAGQNPAWAMSVQENLQPTEAGTNPWAQRKEFPGGLFKASPEIQASSK